MVTSLVCFDEETCKLRPKKILSMFPAEHAKTAMHGVV